MIDEASFKRFLEAEELACRQGQALVEVLDRRRLLLTAGLELEIQVKLLDDVIRRLDRQTVNKIMSYYYGRTDGTPAEMFAAMKLWFETVRQNLANQTLEPL